MNKTLTTISVSALAAGLLLAATPAFADTGINLSGNGGIGFGAFLGDLVHLNVGDKATVNAALQSNVQKNDPAWNWKDATSTATTSAYRKSDKFGGSVEVGTVSSVNSSTVTLASTSSFGSTTPAATVVTNSSTKFKGGATSTASLTSGEKVLVVGTSSTSTPGTITASLIIAIQNAWHFCTHLFSK